MAVASCKGLKKNDSEGLRSINSALSPYTTVNNFKISSTHPATSSQHKSYVWVREYDISSRITDRTVNSRI